MYDLGNNIVHVHVLVCIGMSPISTTHGSSILAVGMNPTPYTLVTSVPVDLLDLLNCCTAVQVPIVLDLQVYCTGRSIGL